MLLRLQVATATSQFSALLLTPRDSNALGTRHEICDQTIECNQEIHDQMTLHLTYDTKSSFNAQLIETGSLLP